MEKSKIGSDIPEAQKLRLPNLVGYQNGAVVSRTLHNRIAGAMTLFAFDEGQELIEHTAPCAALVQVLEGEAGITISGQQLRVMAGEVVLLPANQPHALRVVTKFKMLLTMRIAIGLRSSLCEKIRIPKQIDADISMMREKMNWKKL